LFALEDIHGFKIEQINGQNVLTLNKNTASATNLEFFSAWSELSKKYANGEISKEDYDKWRYNYPESATR
ncbi:MAG: transcriptional regulator, partial [Clostridia bacterium]